MATQSLICVLASRETFESRFFAKDGLVSVPSKIYLITVILTTLHLDIFSFKMILWSLKLHTDRKTTTSNN